MVHSILVKTTVGVLQELEKLTLKFMTEKGTNNGVNILKRGRGELALPDVGAHDTGSHTPWQGGSHTSRQEGHMGQGMGKLCQCELAELAWGAWSMFSHFWGRIPLLPVKLQTSLGHLEDPSGNAWWPGRDREGASDTAPST